jgi:photosystem II stability/assembly factor-like uncharacterized protein
LDFASAELGLACGWDASREEPFCAFSEDGGEGWTRSALPEIDGGVTTVARSRCGDGGVALAVVDGPKHSSASVLTSGDGGRSWAAQPLPRMADVFRFGPLARNSRANQPTADVVVVDAPPIELPPAPPAIAGNAPGPVVWLAGDALDRGPTILGLLLRSEDGGETWTETLGVPGGSLSGVDFVDRATGWVVGAGRILRTDDGGVSFADQTAALAIEEPVAQVTAISAIDAERAIAVGYGRLSGEDFPQEILLVTSDGGASWRPSVVPRDELRPRIREACITPSGAGVSALETRIVLTSDAGATWSYGPDFAFERGTPGSFVRGSGFNEPVVRCSGESHLWILTTGTDPRRDTLWHSPDGGRTWLDGTPAVGVVPEREASVGGFVARFGWIAVPRSHLASSVFRTTDFGRHWTELPSPLEPQELAAGIAFGDGARGVLVSSGRRVLRTADGGESWQPSSLPAGFSPVAADVVP